MTLVGAGTVQTVIPEVLAYELIFNRGKAIDSNMVTPHDWEEIDRRTATEPPSECTCGQCRYGDFQHVGGYPRYRLYLSGEPQEKWYRNEKKRAREKRLVKPFITVAVGRLLIVRKYGSIAADRVAGHTCPDGEKSRCLNPDHLEPMTGLENFLRVRLNGHTSTALKSMISSVMAKIATGNCVLNEAESRIYHAIMIGVLGLSSEGQVEVRDPTEALESQAVEPWQSTMSDEDRARYESTEKIPF